MANAGFPTLSDEDLDYMLGPYCQTKEALAEAKRLVKLNAEEIVPTDELPMLGVRDSFDPSLR